MQGKSTGLMFEAEETRDIVG